jgi:aerobic-type carbon monoxide dehydrogenase small subunit (CoxS/CutS family)
MIDDRRDESPESTNGVSRRSFIQTLGLSAAAGALSAPTSAADEATTDAEVPIVGPDAIDVSLRVNGKRLRRRLDPATTLLEALRIEHGLTGPKEICNRGSCGGCSVLVDGALVASCMMLAVDAEDTEVTTIEGIANGDQLDPIQESFIRHDALQCGYCTPGLIVAVRALLDRHPRPNLEQIREGLAGNICRCGTYTNVYNAVLDASGQAPIRDGSVPR